VVVLDAGEATGTGARFRLSSALRIALLQIGLLVALLAAWELAIRFGFIAVYLYGQPSGIIAKGAKLIGSGELLRDAALTAWEAIAGFLIGTVLGSATGLSI